MRTELPEPPLASSRNSSGEEPYKHHCGSRASPGNQDKVLPLCWFWECISSHLPWIYCLQDSNRNICSPELWSCFIFPWKQFSAKTIPVFRSSRIQNVCFQKASQFSGGLLCWTLLEKRGKKPQNTIFNPHNF